MEKEKSKKSAEKSFHQRITFIFFEVIVLILLGIFLFYLFIDTVSDCEAHYKNEIHKLNKSCRERIEGYQKRVKGMDKIEYVTTMKDVKEVVKTDKTNRREFNMEVFNCVDYSFSLVNALLEKNIYSCTARLDLLDGGAHTVVTVKTEDKEIIYIEPQDDKILDSLRMGDDYCKKVNWDCNWTISRIRSCFL